MDWGHLLRKNLLCGNGSQCHPWNANFLQIKPPYVISITFIFAAKSSSVSLLPEFSGVRYRLHSAAMRRTLSPIAGIWLFGITFCRYFHCLSLPFTDSTIQRIFVISREELAWNRIQYTNYQHNLRYKDIYFVFTYCSKCKLWLTSVYKRIVFILNYNLPYIILAIIWTFRK